MFLFQFLTLSFLVNKQKKIQNIQLLIKNGSMHKVPHQAIEAYTTLLSYSKLAVNKQINFRNVAICPQSHIHEIFTLHKNQNELPHLVLLHGFAGSAMSYIRTFSNLSKKFQVHALDHFGNGFSSKPIIEDLTVTKTQSQILSLYIDSIQSWRIQVGIQKMVLCGHSFGGYIATLYMQKYPQPVERLILLSPVGTSTEEEIQQQLQNRKSQSLKTKITLYWVEKLFNLNIQPSRLFSLPYLGNKAVNNFLKSTIKLEKKEHQMWKKYLKYIFQQQSYLQKTFYACFKWPFISRMSSIAEILKLKNQNTPVQFYFGEIDWTENVAACKMASISQNIHYQVIKGATHNMIFDFPFQVTDRIMHGPLRHRAQFSRL